MNQTNIFLFGRFCLECGGQKLLNFESRKVQELFCYLLLYRTRPLGREKLASLLWSDCSTTQSKRYLRQALWQLQTGLEQHNPNNHPLLHTEPEWLQIDLTCHFWLDVAQFEEAYHQVQGIAGQKLTDEQADTLRQAVRLYSGDLLENWYQDWCIFERERLQNMYLIMLDKLMSYCEARQAYDEGITYGGQILHCDYARERTYRRLMRIYYLSGDRTGALRQYEQCVAALEKELNIKPSAQTTTLFQSIRADALAQPAYTLFPTSPPTDAPPPSVTDVIHHLHQLRQTLATAQRQVEKDIEAIRSLESMS